MKTYYYCYRVGTNAPTFKHDDYTSAVAESKRIAERHPGSVVEVLALCAQSHVKVPQAETEYVTVPGFGGPVISIPASPNFGMGR